MLIMEQMTEICIFTLPQNFPFPYQLGKLSISSTEIHSVNGYKLSNHSPSIIYNMLEL